MKTSTNAALPVPLQRLVRRLGDAKLQREKAVKSHREALQALQAACPHDLVSEGAYQPGDDGDSLPPRRICEICGTEEDGWGCGYKTLHNREGRRVNEIPRIGLRRFQSPPNVAPLAPTLKQTS